MSETKEEKFTPAKIKREIKKLIKFGYSKHNIKGILISKIPKDDIDESMLSMIINDVVKEHPSYELIQKIERSKLIVNKNSKEELYFILDPLSRKVDTVHKTRLFSMYHKPDFSDKTYICDFNYNPHNMTDLYLNSENIWQYNLFQPPEWMEDHFHTKGDQEITSSSLPKIYETFFSHLVNGDKSSYDYILNWLANGLQDRNYCILTTIGKQGIGKGVLGDIMRAVFGSKNFVKTECRVLTKDFNKQILNKRLVYIDELQIKNVSEENRLKTLVNDFIEVEGKGLDAIEVKNYASIYVSSNELDSIRLRGDDRRFSIINLTDTKLIKVMSSHKIKQLFNTANIDQLARFLYNKQVDKEEMMQVFQSSRTEEVRSSSLKSWEEYFMDNICIENGGSYLKVADISDKIEDVFGSRCRPSKAALKRLEDLYPNKFKLERKQLDGKRIWCVSFAMEH